MSKRWVRLLKHVQVVGNPNSLNRTKISFQTFGIFFFCKLIPNLLSYFVLFLFVCLFVCLFCFVSFWIFCLFVCFYVWHSLYSFIKSEAAPFFACPTINLAAEKCYTWYHKSPNPCLMVWSIIACSMCMCKAQVSWFSIGRMRTPVREAFSYGIRHGIRHIHCDSMKYDLMLHWITMNMPYPVPYPVWKCLLYGSTHPF